MAGVMKTRAIQGASAFCLARCWFGIRHMIGLEELDAWWLRLTGLDREFIGMVFEGTRIVEAAAGQVWPNHRRYSIWNRLGYCLVDQREQ